MPLPRRGLAPVIKRLNIPIIILANYSPSTIYTKFLGEGGSLDPTYERLEVINAQGNIRISMLMENVEEEDENESEEEVSYSSEDEEEEDEQ